MAEAGVALPSVGVQDPEGRSPARWTSPVAGDDHLRSLADDVPAEPDPRSTGELEPDPGRLADGRCQTARRCRGTWRLEHDEGDPGTACERGQPPESIGESRSRAATARPPFRRQARRQVDDQQVDRPSGQERARDRETLLGIGRGQDDQPLRLDPPRDGLHRVERRRQVQPGNDRACRLGLGRKPQRQRRPPARHVTSHRHAHPPWHAARPEDGIELSKARREDSVWVGNLRREWQPALRGPRRRPCEPSVRGRFERHRGQRADNLADEPRRGRTPARSKGRQGRRQVRRWSGHAGQYRTYVRMNQGRSAGRGTRARLRDRVGM